MRTGAVKLKPVVEINPRYTMGRVLVELMRQTCQNSFGTFRLVNAAQLRAEGFENFPDYARSLAEKFPLQLEGEPVPRIRERRAVPERSGHRASLPRGFRGGTGFQPVQFLLRLTGMPAHFRKASFRCSNDKLDRQDACPTTLISRRWGGS